jgi:hypothetical protein
MKRACCSCHPEVLAGRSTADKKKIHEARADAVIRVYDRTGNLMEVHEHTGDFKDW